VLVDLGFPQANGLFRKLSPGWSRTFKNLRQPCYSAKHFEEYRFEGVKICSPQMFRAVPRLRWPILHTCYTMNILC